MSLSICISGVWFTDKQPPTVLRYQAYVARRWFDITVARQCYQHRQGRSGDGTQVHGLWAGWH